jgi:hypothetical protein
MTAIPAPQEVEIGGLPLEVILGKKLARFHVTKNNLGVVACACDSRYECGPGQPEQVSEILSKNS